MALTEEQQLVVDAGPEAKVLVTAGPGTGKTHVLIQRLSYLISTADIAPGEILVLSFSRAAVTEIRDRLASVGGGASYVRASTFDSFATRLLVLAERSDTWQTENYDERIRHATQLIRTNQEAKEEIRSYRHVIVDEIQDLVGDRADLVKAIVELGSGGFTLFGDPAQGIYNYQLEGEARRIGSAALYQWIRAHCSPCLVERGLTHNFRITSQRAAVALWAGAELNSSVPEYDKIRYRLETVVMQLPSTGDLSLAIPMLREADQSTAILCRNNGQALTISGQLYDSRIAHRLQGRATDRRLGRWLAVALRDIDGSSVGKRQFLDLMEQKADSDLPPPTEIWRRLKRIERRRYEGSLDLGVVNERLRCGDVPDDFSETVPSKVVVSTIHRAKGLEFERVLVLPPSPITVDPTEVAEETRILYVALTRARSEIFHLNAPNTLYLRTRDDLDRRWVMGGWQHWMRSAIEVRGEDVLKDVPAGVFLISGDPIVLQDYIRTQVKPGDPVVLHRTQAIIEGQTRIFYSIEHNGIAVGITSMSFGATLFSVLKVNAHWNVKWPLRIEGLHVEAVDTAAGLPMVSRAARLGGCGVWLRVRVYGLGRFIRED
ncbi:MAG: UvrD-helicase domain-containing protein [Bryobacteraceae bacterium]|jgi:hypothetical protein